MKKILILNTGGTFNKVYNPLNGELEVSKKGEALKEILKHQTNLRYDLKNIIHKDSLFITDDDREKIKEQITNTKCSTVIIVHGTDTINKTADFLSKSIQNKMVILTGTMIPYSINPIEATSNFSMAVGYALSCFQKGIFISMHGMVEEHSKVFKNRKIGEFQRVEPVKE